MVIYSHHSLITILVLFERGETQNLYVLQEPWQSVTDSGTWALNVLICKQ